MTRRLSAGIVGIWLGVSAAVCAAEPAVPTVYTDRAQWFQVRVPDGWQADPKITLVGTPQVLALSSTTAPGVRLTLAIRPVPTLPELVTRAQLVEQARAILKAVALGRTPAGVTEITGWPMTGLLADYTDQSTVSSRVTVLLDPPRKRAFVWTATAPPAQFPAYDVAFDQVVAGLVPALPES